jgi:hypothetical protein
MFWGTMTIVIFSLQDIMLISLILGCPEQTYSVPTTFTQPSEATKAEDIDPSHNPSEENHPPEANPPPHPKTDATPQGNAPPAAEADAPPPPEGFIAEVEPPLNNEELRSQPDGPEPGDFDASEAVDGCILSHDWRDLRSDDVEKVLFRASFETDEPVQQLLVDFISLETGKIEAGIICPSKEIKVDIPKNIGLIQVAIFIDNNQNGPSVDDLQGISEKIEIKDEEITIKNITLSDTPLSYYNFKE